MTLARTHLVLVALVALAACKRDRPFTTLAKYEAPKSGFVVLADATGIVAPGEDLSSAVPTVAIICPKSAGHPLRIDVNDWRANVTDGAKTTPIRWNAPSFTRALDDAGYPATDYAEIDEAMGAINGVSSGPKGTRMPGQTRAIRTVNVSFAAHAPISVRDCP